LDLNIGLLLLKEQTDENIAFYLTVLFPTCLALTIDTFNAAGE